MKSATSRSFPEDQLHQVARTSLIGKLPNNPSSLIHLLQIFNAMPRLGSLATELSQRIGSFCSGKSLISLSKTCRNLHSSCYDPVVLRRSLQHRVRSSCGPDDVFSDIEPGSLNISRPFSRTTSSSAARPSHRLKLSDYELGMIRHAGRDMHWPWTKYATFATLLKRMAGLANSEHTWSKSEYRR